MFFVILCGGHHKAAKWAKIGILNPGFERVPVDIFPSGFFHSKVHQKMKKNSEWPTRFLDLDPFQSESL